MKELFGRNMYVILPYVPTSIGRVLRVLGFKFAENTVSDWDDILAPVEPL